MARRRTVTQLVRRVTDLDEVRQPDEVVVEEPLEIRLDGHRVTTTMRTPGHDFELAAGFCHTDGLLGGARVRAVQYCVVGQTVDTAFRVVTVDTGGRAPIPTPRLSTTTSSCGWCGTDEIDAVTERLHPLDDLAPIPIDVLAAMPDRVAPHQELFAITGGVHGAASFDIEGNVGIVREDIGRHNAVDKVVGVMVLGANLPANDQGLFVSGRVSFEIVQKAWAAGFSAIVAVSAPSSLAVLAARRAGITLAGFARPGRLNLYVERGNG